MCRLSRADAVDRRFNSWDGLDGGPTNVLIIIELIVNINISVLFFRKIIKYKTKKKFTNQFILSLHKQLTTQNNI